MNSPEAGLTQQPSMGVMDEQNAQLLRRLHRNMHVLGAVLVLLGTSFLVALWGETSWVPFGIIIALGVLTCLKYPWALALAVLLFSIPVMGDVFLSIHNGKKFGLDVLLELAFIIQAFRVLYWAGLLNKAGVSLKAKPRQVGEGA